MLEFANRASYGSMYVINSAYLLPDFSPKPRSIGSPLHCIAAMHHLYWANLASYCNKPEYRGHYLQ